MSDKRPPTNLKVQPNFVRKKNSARVSPLSGRHRPNKYTSPQEAAHLISPEEFRKEFILNKPGNRYTDDNDIVELPDVPSPQSTTTPVTATTATSTQGSDTRTSFGGSTIGEHEETAPTTCFGLKRSDSRKRSKDDSSDEYIQKPSKKLQRSSSWKSWFMSRKH